MDASREGWTRCMCFDLRPMPARPLLNQAGWLSRNMGPADGSKGSDQTTVSHANHHSACQDFCRKSGLGTVCERNIRGPSIT